ncbi:MAG: RICIN domain-containing protein [Moorea sp. SIO3I7]|uniref:RICIN domain-containing protein n=1 Tax=unclassified Moorena TaxID=2683338 RepID=UPI0013BEC38B|nr:MULTISPECIES: RICIN domain-containing protein [unclassified Moorena]NEN96372.1 RICIN domain-containing protein [Moorena sp. SIO3I7]NEO07500.1 RICIN domain-containing protein [Moorena sp. SIO3I8]NEP24289.1 RICIN domain-containing protein [Moorena sp. SIO3I6]
MRKPTKIFVRTIAVLIACSGLLAMVNVPAYGRCFRIQNANNGRYLFGRGDGTVGTFDKFFFDQIWKLIKHDVNNQNYYEIKNANNGRNLFGQGDGTVGTFDKFFHDQLWKLIKHDVNNQDYYKIKNGNNGRNLFGQGDGTVGTFDKFFHDQLWLFIKITDLPGC